MLKLRRESENRELVDGLDLILFFDVQQKIKRFLESFVYD